MSHLVGQVVLQPPRRSTLHTGARLSAASIATAQAVADVEAIGWTECPIGCVAVLAGFWEEPEEALEPMPPPAHRVLSLAVRRARSKRTRRSAYPRRAASEKGKVKDEDLEEGEIWQPPRSPPPPSPPRPQTMVPPPPSSPCRRQPRLEPMFSSPPGFSSPPPGFGAPLPPCWKLPTTGLLPTPQAGFVAPPPPFWSRPPFAQPPPQAPWRWPHPPPRWAPPHMQQQQRPPPPWGCMRPPAPRPMLQQYPPRFDEQQHTPQHRQVVYFYAVFGCTELDLGIELDKNTKTKMVMKWPQFNTVVWMCSEFAVGISGGYPIQNAVWMH